ncbi:acyl carrier protein [Dactylosporangium sp. CA-139066]|uniref:acyl carrier protein n=1 Tax=Dactylosporangium sp. CA-139066 TaxID=3239930 RepID=UPI003D8ADAB6
MSADGRGLGTQRALRARLARLVADEIGADIDPDTNFFEAGLGSAELMRVHAAVTARLGYDGLSITALFTYPSLRALARHLAGQDIGRPHPETGPSPEESAHPREDSGPGAAGVRERRRTRAWIRSTIGAAR